MFGKTLPTSVLKVLFVVGFIWAFQPTPGLFAQNYVAAPGYQYVPGYTPWYYPADYPGYSTAVNPAAYPVAYPGYYPGYYPGFVSTDGRRVMYFPWGYRGQVDRRFAYLRPGMSWGWPVAYPWIASPQFSVPNQLQTSYQGPYWTCTAYRRHRGLFRRSPWRLYWTPYYVTGPAVQAGSPIPNSPSFPSQPSTTTP